MTSNRPPVLFDLAQIERHRDRAAPRYGDHAFLKARESSQLIERLNDVSRSFPDALDLGAHDGQAGAALLDTQQVEHVTALEPSQKLLELAKARGLDGVRGDGERLPFAAGTFDLVASVLALHWANDLPGVLTQIRSVLKPDGLFLGCLLSGGTLSELRTSLIEAESSLTGGVSPRVSPLPSLQDMAGLMQRAGFALPVADVDRVTVRYASPMKLMADLRGMGEQAAFAIRDGQERRPLSRRLLARTVEVYHDRFSDPDGKVRASFEIVWLSGWAPAAGQPQPLRPGSAKFSLADAVKGKRGD